MPERKHFFFGRCSLSHYRSSVLFFLKAGRLFSTENAKLSAKKTASTPTQSKECAKQNNKNAISNPKWFRCFVAMQFLSWIYSLFWRTILRPEKCSSVQKKGMSWSICRKETWVACRSCWWRKMDKIDALQCIFNGEYFQSGVTWSTNVFCHRPVPVISVCLQPEMQHQCNTVYTTDGQKMCLNYLGGKQIQIPDRSANSLQGPEKISQISLESFSFEKSLTI